jgi:hypothetical protein
MKTIFKMLVTSLLFTQMIALDKILIYADNGRFVKEIILSNSDAANTIVTDDLKNGIYYFHLVDKERNIQIKRIAIKHQ